MRETPARGTMRQGWICLVLLGLLTCNGCLSRIPTESVADPAPAAAATVRVVAATSILSPTLSTVSVALEAAGATPVVPTQTAPTSTATALLSPTGTPMPETAELPPLIAVDPGHGGRDLGAPHRDAEGKLDYTEAEVNLDLALRVRDLLQAEGFRVYMTRDGDYAVNEPRVDINGDEVLTIIDESQARVDAINAVNADLLLSIHQNAYYTPEGEQAPDVGGTVTFYCADRPFSDQSLHFAELIQKHLIAAMADLDHEARDRGVMDDMVLYVEGEPGSHLILLGPQAERIVRPSNMPGALSETLFLTHAREGELARDPIALDRLARAYADAVLAYFADTPIVE